MCTYLGVSAEFGAKDINEAAIKNAQVTYLEGYMLDNATTKAALHKAADIARAAGSKVALALCNPILPAGSIIIFDEFHCIPHEYRAFDDWAAAFMRKFEVLGVTPNYTQLALRLR